MAPPNAFESTTKMPAAPAQLESIFPELNAIHNTICEVGMYSEQLIYLFWCLGIDTNACILDNGAVFGKIKGAKYIVYGLGEYVIKREKIPIGHFVLYDVQRRIYFDPMGYKPEFAPMFLKFIKEHNPGQRHYASKPILPQLGTIKLLYPATNNNAVIYYSPFMFQVDYDFSCGLWCLLYMFYGIDYLFAEVTPKKHINRTSVDQLREEGYAITKVKTLQKKFKLPRAIDNYTRHKIQSIHWKNKPTYKSFMEAAPTLS